MIPMTVMVMMIVPVRMVVIMAMIVIMLVAVMMRMIVVVTIVMVVVVIVIVIVIVVMRIARNRQLLHTTARHGGHRRLRAVRASAINAHGASPSTFKSPATAPFQALPHIQTREP